MPLPTRLPAEANLLLLKASDAVWGPHKGQRSWNIVMISLQKSVEKLKEVPVPP